MLKQKQIELIEKVYLAVKNKFPDIELGEIAYGDTDTWVDFIIPEELFGEEELDGILAEYSTDILCDYGYSILFYAMPAKPSENNKIIA